MGTLREDLARDVERVEETHISLVFLGRDEVWKVKKPVSLGFLDYGTPEQRRTACEDEVRLNRRLAPDVYLGVVAVVCGPDGTHRIAGSARDGLDDGGRGAGRPEPVDWAVHMVRLEDRDRADVRLLEGRLSPAQLERVATHVAAFHASVRADAETARFGTLEAIGRNVRENFEQTRGSVAGAITADQAREIETWQTSFLHEHADLFAARAAAGHVRDGHGDLRLEHVYLTDRAQGEADIRIIDCIEFSARLRYGDTCSDVAFLAMDLAWHGRPDLAELFLAAYAREANDFDLYAVVDFYESYRAYVRGKVASILVAAEQVETERRERAAAEARRYYLLSLASERRRLEPARVVAVGGVIGVGKSTIAEALAAELAAPVVSSDRTRKLLVGVEPTQSVATDAWKDAYAADMTERVYAEVLRRAGVILASGRTVVLDASFRSREQRRRVRRLADEHDVPFLFVECRAPDAVCRARLIERARHRAVSDGRVELFDDFAARWEVETDLEPARHLVVDTTRATADNVCTLIDRLAAAS